VRNTCRCSSASGEPFEKYGANDSLLLGSRKTLGWFAPRSIAAQPSSVNQIGLLSGTHAVGVPDLTPPGRS